VKNLSIYNNRNGVEVAAIVTDRDGLDQWRESRQYIGYTVPEARHAFRDYLRAYGLKVA
jgi:hypothetical protein